jgi:type II secretory ATPase GspE/PulE/Tfp pilus assembly ATPase PilB-like protein
MSSLGSSVGNEARDKARFREADEVATIRRAQLLRYEYLDTQNYSLPNGPIFDIISVQEMYKDYFTILSADVGTYVFAITNRTPQSLISSLKSRFQDHRIIIKMTSESGWRDIMKVYGIRFRIDGMLHVIAALTHPKYYQVQQSIAVRAGISSSSNDAQTSHLSERVTGTDGQEEVLNMRIETVPTVYGQDAVLRLFNFDIELLNLDNLGLDAREREPIEEVIAHPHGMVLVVGPTGSGKTTTLYSILMRLNTPERKLMTLEDPVEYGLDGMSQIPVDTRNGDSFASKFRAVLRLDPDVIMVGEIRDEDTAHTALQASITGHLVLSTFHASSAAAAMSRMLGMVGRNPIFASAVKLIVSQRLVRKLDPATRQAYQPDPATIKHFQENLSDLPSGIQVPQDLNSFQLFNPGKSEENPFGYKGRTSILEELTIGEEIRALLGAEILPTSQQLEEAAKRGGMITMYQAGLLKCLSGETTLEEINRVM